jgi:virginiamycin B lyase
VGVQLWFRFHLARASVLVAVLLLAAAVPVMSAGSPAPPSDVAPTPTPTLVPAQRLNDLGAVRLTVQPPADWLVTADGSLWGAVGAGVQQFAGSDGGRLGTLLVPGETCLAMDVGFGALWVGACNASGPSLVRIDPTTATVIATIPLGVPDLQEESSVAAGEGAVWVPSVAPHPMLVKVDPVTNTVLASYPLPNHAGGVRAGYGGVWVAQPGSNTVLHIDPASGATVAEVAVGATPRFMAIGEGAVWAMNEADGTVTRIDPATDTVTATILVTPTRIDGGDIAVGGGSVWARISDQLVARIDPATNQVIARYGPPSGSGSVAADDTAVWISAHDVNAIWRLAIATP